MLSNIVGKYDCGANDVKIGMFHYIAYDDCNLCHGKGYKREYSPFQYGYDVQCPACRDRFPSKGSLKSKINALLDGVDKILKQTAKEKHLTFARNKRLSPEALEIVNDLAYGDYGKKYRQMLVEYWSMTEPKLIEE